ncbi:hypothetical protein [Vibrio crassostreae]|uniref:hypothetical protein n=1 Tax=Vibrio crassostreae TaxID=246167 RepID=UPI001B313627|nr:hypothetical protein [Vibrio crassostreae]
MSTNNKICEGMEVVNQHGVTGVVIESIWNFTDAPFQIRRSDGFFVAEVREDGTTESGVTSWREHILPVCVASTVKSA